jgi:hypothetical protein
MQTVICYGHHSQCHPERRGRCEYVQSCEYYEATEPAMHRRIDSFAVFENSEAFAIEDIPAEAESEDPDEMAAKVEELAQVMYQAQSRRRMNLVKRMHTRRR